eukprot:3999744-Amphidinium_carterae.1
MDWFSPKKQYTLNTIFENQVVTSYASERASMAKPTLARLCNSDGKPYICLHDLQMRDSETPCQEVRKA